MTEVWRSLADVPDGYGATVATLGNFDGVHRGHQAVLEQMVKDARESGQKAVAMTFDPHPLAVHRPEDPPELITGLEDRLERLAATGLDAILVQEYTLDFAQQTPEEFVQVFVLDGLNAATVVVGADTKFGARNSGDVSTMRSLGEQLGFAVEVVDEAHGPTNGEDRQWSSSWVRELLAAGRAAEAAEVLGRPHRIRGTVVHGDALGREIGFPTVNLDVTGGMIPRHGVYAARVTVLDGGDEIDDAPLTAAVSIGPNYTVGGTEVRVEAHLIDVAGVDLYGATVAIDVVKYRRGMEDFGSIEVLTQALAEDVRWCREVFGTAGEKAT